MKEFNHGHVFGKTIRYLVTCAVEPHYFDLSGEFFEITGIKNK